MSWKRGERVQTNYKGDVVHGVVTDSAAKKTSVLLDDGVTNLSGSPRFSNLLPSLCQKGFAKR